MTPSSSLAASDTIMVRTSDEDVFDVGTIESVMTDGYMVSYPDQNNGRSADAKFVAFSDAIDPSQIDSKTPMSADKATTVPAGARYLAKTEFGSYRFVEVIKDTDIASVGEISVQPLTIDASGRVVNAAASATHVGTKPLILRPSDLAAERRLRFMAPVDPWIDVYATPVFERWTWRGRARATFANAVIEGDLVLKVRRHRIKARFTYPREIAIRETTALLEGMGKGVLEPLEAGQSNPAGVTTWRADQCRFQSGGYSISVRERGPQYSIGSFLIPILDVIFDGTAKPTMTREIFEGANYDVFTHYILKRMPRTDLPMFRVNDAIRTTVFDRAATIYSPPRESRFDEAAKVARVAVVYPGVPLEAEQYEALTTLLGYLAGGRLRHVSTERFVPAARVSYRRVHRGGGTKHLTPPAPIGAFDGPVLETILSQFEKMLSNLHASLVKNAKGTASVFHHYAEARNHQYPTTSFVLMSVAIDSMISLVTGDAQSNATLLPGHQFDIIKPRMLDALNLAFSQEAELSGLDAERERLSNKIRDNLNTFSNTKRLQTFWVDDAGIALTKAEIKLLRTRNIAVHQGHLGGDERTTASLMDNYAKAAQMANLFNRGALSALLKYIGPVLDATDGVSYIRISDGLPFASESAASAPKDELRIEFTMAVDEASDNIEDGAE